MADRLVVAELGPAHGLRGQVLARIHGLEPEELLSFPRLWLRRGTGEETDVRVREARRHGSSFVVALEGVADRTTAERLRGSELLCLREDLPEPEGAEWYVADLVGANVVTDAGELLGTLREVLKMPAHDVYVVNGSRGEVLLPATDEVILGFEDSNRTLTVHLLPGLLEEEDERSSDNDPSDRDS